MDHNLNDNQMGIKQREKIIDELRKENFGLKMRIYFLQQNIQNLTPEGMHTIVTEV
ncbi:hypothetical protein BC833DRAFT_572535 [Globomyces pollinis-pini]|nr:hypothetical protein BC833DRAFT_572535 [Globomyces pollinis-pini]